MSNNFGNLQHLIKCKESDFSYALVMGAVRSVVKERVILMPFIPEDVFGRHMFLGENSLVTKNGTSHIFDGCQSDDDREERIVGLLRAFFHLAADRGDMKKERVPIVDEFQSTYFALSQGGLDENPPPESFTLFRGAEFDEEEDDLPELNGDEDDCPYVNPKAKLAAIEQRNVERIIIEVCAESVGTTETNVKNSKTKSHRVQHARSLSIFLMREMSKRSFGSLIAWFHNCDESEAVDMYRIAKRRQVFDPETTEILDQLAKTVLDKLKAHNAVTYAKLKLSSSS
jgi:hypothetical protein